MSRASVFRLYSAVAAASPRSTIVVLVAIGAALRVWQYLANSSLWLDEAALARNIIDRRAIELFGPLDYAQIAPIGFLLIEKGVVSLFGTSEYALRAFPLLCGLLALFLFRSVAKRTLSGWAEAYAVGLFALGMPLIYIASQVKQYSSDVAAAILILLAAIEIRARGLTPRRAWWLGVTGAVIVWFSIPAVLVLAGIGTGLAIVAALERDGKSLRLLVITATLWVPAAMGSALVAQRSLVVEDRGYLEWFWSAGFMPMPPTTPRDLTWFFDRLMRAFGVFGGEMSGMGRTTGGLNYHWPGVFLVVALAGFWVLYRRRRDITLLLVLPIAIAAALSAWKLYPFTGRVFMYLLPSLLIATAAGGSQLLSVWPSRLRLLVPGVAALLLVLPVYAAATALPPFWLQHLRPIIQHVNTHRESGDAMYVHYPAGQAFQYYARRYEMPTGAVVIGRCAAGKPREYLRQVDDLRGRNRVWVFVTFHSFLKRLEAALIVDYLDRIGQRLDRIAVLGTPGRPMEGAYGYLYDLSDRDRGSSASWDTFPIAPYSTVFAHGPWPCHGVDRSEKGARSVN